jgi:hypothetical protein
VLTGTQLFPTAFHFLNKLAPTRGVDNKFARFVLTKTFKYCSQSYVAPYWKNGMLYDVKLVDKGYIEPFALAFMRLDTRIANFTLVGFGSSDMCVLVLELPSVESGVISSKAVACRWNTILGCFEFFVKDRFLAIQSDNE